MDSHHPVEHAGRGDDVGAGLRMARCNPVHEGREGLVIEEVFSAAAVPAHDPAVPVTRVLACADIGDDDYPGACWP